MMYFFACFYNIATNISFTTITHNPHSHQLVIIFILKLNHEHRKHLHHWFQYMLIGVVCNSVSCIAQKSLKVKSYSLVRNICRAMDQTKTIINLFLFRRLSFIASNCFPYDDSSIFVHSVKRLGYSMSSRRCLKTFMNRILKISQWLP